MTNKKIVEQVAYLLRQRGQNALDISKRAILQEKIGHKPLQEALNYFIDTTWPKILHPGLLSIYCEAVGGKPEETTQVGAAMVLLVGAADLHDDIIDQSAVKGSKPTVYGKFGRDIAVLAGDALLIEGMYLLNRALETYTENKRDSILGLIKQAFFDLSSAEANEAGLRGSTDLSGKQYLELVRKKVAVAEVTARIGAILGNGTVEEIEVLADYGHTLGLLLTIRDEFIDVFEPEELVNRYKNEILPLPVLYAFQDPLKRETILRLLTVGKLTAKKNEQILDIIIEGNEVVELKKEMKRLCEIELSRTICLRNYDTIKLLLKMATEDLI